MNAEIEQGHKASDAETSKAKKSYHAPELTMLGAIQAVIDNTGTLGDDGGVTMGNSGS